MDLIGKRVEYITCCANIKGIIVGYYSATEVLVQQLEGDPVSVFIDQLTFVDDKMETNLFSCNSQEQIDDYLFIYYQCLLKVDIGHWKKGTLIDKLSIDIYKGTLHILDSDQNVVESFKVKLQLI
ncbi:MAG: hypothetical protein IPM51_11705 [Sphingobacteriaceae bacterium]|nr:hypothetical protein [Sphingobacteriaceae bacterium]